MAVILPEKIRRLARRNGGWKLKSVTTLVLLAGVAIGILATYFIAQRLQERGFLFTGVVFWAPVLVTAGAVALKLNLFVAAWPAVTLSAASKKDCEHARVAAPR